MVGVVLPKIKISVFGAKMLSSPETPGISPDTPGFEHSGGNSGYRPGNSGFGSPDTPEMLSRILRVYARILRIFGLESERGECKTRFISFIFPCSVG